MAAHGCHVEPGLLMLMLTWYELSLTGTCTKEGYYRTAYARRAAGINIPKGTCLPCVSRLSTQYDTVRLGGSPSRCYKSVPNAARTHCGALAALEGTQFGFVCLLRSVRCGCLWSQSRCARGARHDDLQYLITVQSERVF